MAYAEYSHAPTSASVTQALEELIQILLVNGGELELEDAVEHLSSHNRSIVLYYGELNFIKHYRQLFAYEVIDAYNREVNVILNVSLEFCLQAEESGGCDTKGCKRLHLCPFFIKGNCKFGSKCKRSHSYDDEHTVRVLNYFGLGFLRYSSLLQGVLKMIVDESELQRTAARHVSAGHLPGICKHYNKGRCMKEDYCPWLHVCKYFIDGRCKFGEGCERDHNFSDSHNIKILQQYNMEKIGKRKVLRLLKGRERKNEMSRSFDSQTPHERSPSSANFSASYVNLEDENERDIEICGFNLGGKCNYGNSCIHRHTALPYLWEFTANGQNWESFPSDVNTALEQSYCNVQYDCCSVRIRGILYRVQFTDMIAVPVLSNTGLPPVGNCRPFRVRRLSTVSSVVAAAGHVFSTRWLWYWQDENNKWQSYDTPADGHAVNTTSSLCLEREYMSGKDCHSFSALQQDYTMCFREGYQQNDVYKTKRPVRRRPAEFVTKQNMKDIAQRRRTAAQVQSGRNSASTEPDDGLPSHWCPVPEGMEYKCVPLDPMDFEYKGVEGLFRETMWDVRPSIVKIDRVQNPELWTAYNQKRNRMGKKAGRVPCEGRLFHGTKPDTIDAICQQGFDWRMCGKHGTKYGKGSYFACSAYYSHHYTVNQDTPCSYKHMFLARVLLGSYTNGDSSLTRPPPKDPTNPNILFDSCCDDTRNPALFVVFDNCQSYPEFLITYV